MYPVLSQLSHETLKGKRVLVRVDFNVPLGNNNVVDPYEAFRIHKMFPTITLLQESGARVILLAHLEKDGNNSLRPLVDYLNEHTIDCGFVPNLDQNTLEEVLPHLPEGGVVLLENLRSNTGEESNDTDFTKMLATYGDLYVNEAFSVSHRAHASIVGIPQHLPGYLGIQHEKEIAALDHLKNEGNLLVIIGGAKFKTKLQLIKQFLKRNIPVFVGGALAHAFYKAKGLEIGTSFFDNEVDVQDMIHDSNLVLPEYVLVKEESDNVLEKNITEVLSNDSIVDIGTHALETLEKLVSTTQHVLWNGPLGWYEEGFTEGSKKCAELLGKSNAKTIVGGGDTITVLEESDQLNNFDFVSTGGGALLDYLVNGTLPGLEVLKTK